MPIQPIQRNFGIGECQIKLDKFYFLNTKFTQKTHMETNKPICECELNSNSSYPAGSDRNVQITQMF